MTIQELTKFCDMYGWPQKIAVPEAEYEEILVALGKAGLAWPPPYHNRQGFTYRATWVVAGLGKQMEVLDP